MTNNIGLPELAWQIGIKQGPLREFLYDALPQREWPGKGRRWQFNEQDARCIRELHQTVPEKARECKVVPDDDTMYDICKDLEEKGIVHLDSQIDLAEVMRDLIYDHGFNVELVSRHHHGSMLRTIEGREEPAGCPGFNDSCDNVLEGDNDLCPDCNTGRLDAQSPRIPR